MKTHIRKIGNGLWLARNAGMIGSGELPHIAYLNMAWPAISQKIGKTPSGHIFMVTK